MAQPVMMELPEGYIYDAVRGGIEYIGKADSDAPAGPNPAANTGVAYTERSGGLVGHAIDKDDELYKFMAVGKAQWEPTPNANIRWVDIYVAPPGSDVYTLVPTARTIPMLKEDICGCTVVGPDLLVSVTTHFPSEAPRDSNVEYYWVHGICHYYPEGRPHTHAEYAPTTHAHPEYVPKAEATRGVCDPFMRPYFRRQNRLTRGQMCKIQVVSMEAAKFEFPPIPQGRQTFADVPTTDPFWIYIEKMASIGAIGGYPCDPEMKEKP